MTLMTARGGRCKLLADVLNVFARPLLSHFNRVEIFEAFLDKGILHAKSFLCFNRDALLF